MNTSAVLPAMSWSLPVPAPKPEKRAKGEIGSNRSSRSSRSSRNFRSGMARPKTLGLELRRLTCVGERNEKARLDDESRERPRIEDGPDRRQGSQHSQRTKGRENSGYVLGRRGHSEYQREHESRPRIQDRDDRRDDRRPPVRWKEDPDDSSQGGSDSKPPGIYDGRDYRPTERRRKSRKVQDPGFADFID